MHFKNLHTFAEQKSTAVPVLRGIKHAPMPKKYVTVTSPNDLGRFEAKAAQFCEA